MRPTPSELIKQVRRVLRDVIEPELQKISDRHPSVGEVRGLGVFWAVELVRSRSLHSCGLAVWDVGALSVLRLRMHNEWLGMLGLVSSSASRSRSAYGVVEPMC